jgi:ATP-dependent RNA helicase DeaD
MKTFKELGLNQDIMASLDELKFVNPSPIQEKAIPFLLNSKNDLIALAQTGTGKTAAFTLPILNQIKSQNNELQVIILCPTRELCIQLFQDIVKFSKHSKKIEVAAVYGGERIDLQIRALRKGVNIVVGTPGRVLDLIKRKVLKLQAIKWLVLDEADEMLDMGFKDDLDAILSETPASRQTLLFSATMSKSVRNIANQYMKDIEEISMGENNIGAEKVTHEYYVVRAGDRFEALKRILDNLPGVYGILFCRTKNETQRVADMLKQANYNAEAMHGDISQAMRTKIMDRFKRKQISLLVATDVAARGIDVNDLSHVINYNLPDQNEVYTHRSGRTGRAQKSGVSISIFTPSDIRKVKMLENMIGKTFEYKKVPSKSDIFQKQIDSFLEKIDETDIATIDSIGNFSEIEEKLKKLKKEDLIKHLIVDKFRHLINTYQNAGEINAEVKVPREFVDDKNTATLKINFGKRNGFDIKALFSLFNTNQKLKTIKIGKISLMPEYTLFGLEKDRADEAVRLLSGLRYRGKTIEASLSNQAPSYAPAKKKRFGAYGGYKGNSSYKKRY